MDNNNNTLPVPHISTLRTTCTGSDRFQYIQTAKRTRLLDFEQNQTCSNSWNTAHSTPEPNRPTNFLPISPPTPNRPCYTASTAAILLRLNGNSPVPPNHTFCNSGTAGHDYSSISSNTGISQTIVCISASCSGIQHRYWEEAQLHTFLHSAHQLEYSAPAIN